MSNKEKSEAAIEKEKVIKNQPQSEFETSSSNDFQEVKEQMPGGDGDLPDPETLKLPNREVIGEGRTLSDHEKPKEEDHQKEDGAVKGFDFRGNK